MTGRSSSISLSRALAACLLMWLAADAQALPRFAIRTGLPCFACHVNATGGGMRNAFARNVFVPQFLAMRSRFDALVSPARLELTPEVALGADVRAGYLYLKSPRPELMDTSSFSTMQADLYMHVQVGERLGVYLDKGAYGGFEAFALIHPFCTQATGADITVKVGRFVVPFGLRDSNHTYFTREVIGLGAIDRDNGVELGLTYKRSAAHLSVTNGTYGDAFFDTGGSKHMHFYDKAASLRLIHQPRLGPLRLLLSASAFYNKNADRQNPLFVPALFVGSQSSEISLGVDELRVGLALGVGLGRLAYRGEIVGVSDKFAGADLKRMTGYASLQELSVVATQGLELLGTYEFADSDVNYQRGRVDRVGAGVEWFPLPSLEVSALARHSFGAADFLPGPREDLLLVTHVFF